MKFRTEIALDKCPFSLDTGSRVLLLGSCFAEGVGERLTDALPEGQVRVNPFGVLYNPESIGQALHVLMAEPKNRAYYVGRSLFVAQDGRWHSWLFGTKLTGASRSECQERCMAALSGIDLHEVDLLVVTLGTDHYYELLDDSDHAWRAVTNCHKEPASKFAERISDGIMLRQVLEEWRLFYPNLRMLLTVSPYRYAKYGMHGSQLAKARLLLLADQICQFHPKACYFPAYELLLDELRDYRFYAADMLHPSDQAVDYIYERFAEWCFTPQLHAYAAERQRELRQQRHRPIQP